VVKFEHHPSPDACASVGTWGPLDDVAFALVPNNKSISPASSSNSILFTHCATVIKINTYTCAFYRMT